MPQPKNPGRSTSSKLTDLFWRNTGLVLAGCTLFYLLLGWGESGISLDSATYAVVARNMAELGDWFNPHYTRYYLNPFAEHPPLVMWAQGLIFFISEPNDSTARIFSGLCVLGSILAVYGLGKQVKGRSFGFLSGLILLLTYNFIQIGNATFLDVPLSFFVMLTLLLIVKIDTRGITLPRVLGCGAALGGAWLTKGVVSAPVWIAVVAYGLFWNRSVLRQGRFYIIFAVALVMAGAHLLLDQIYNNGYFFDYYFFNQIVSKFIHGGTESGGDWWAYTAKFAILYQPFIFLLIPGIYYAIKDRKSSFYPIMTALLFYFIFYGTASRLYYHYFPPAYALAAPIAALPLYFWLKESVIKKIAIIFPALWLLTGVGILLAHVNIHHVRTPELYNLKTEMNEYLKNKPSRDGIMIGPEAPDWDFVAKTAWHWRSDIKLSMSIDEATRNLQSDQFSYLLVDNHYREIIDSLRTGYSSVMKVGLKNNKVTLFFPTNP